MGARSGRELFLAAANGKPTPRPPVWMMRQAGRYLPEYRKRREEYSFLEAISTPAVAEEISLQPWNRYHPDGVVMYSDILTALEPLEIPYHIESGTGPVIEEPVRSGSVADLHPHSVSDSLGDVGELLSRLSHRLGDDAAVIGFVGGPFTLAAYLVQGRPTKAFMALRRLRYESAAEFEQLLETIGDVLEEYVAFQVRHGADIVQLFDTYAGLMTERDYRDMLLPVHRRVLDAVDVPTIVYARNMGGRLDLLRESGADVIGLDWTVDIDSARRALDGMPVQGNLDPAALYGTPEDVRARASEVIRAAADTSHILNLGHGVDKDTPPENVQAFFEAARSVDQ